MTDDIFWPSKLISNIELAGMNRDRHHNIQSCTDDVIPIIVPRECLLSPPSPRCVLIGRRMFKHKFPYQIWNLQKHSNLIPFSSVPWKNLKLTEVFQPHTLFSGNLFLALKKFRDVSYSKIEHWVRSLMHITCHCRNLISKFWNYLSTSFPAMSYKPISGKVEPNRSQCLYMSTVFANGGMPSFFFCSVDTNQINCNGPSSKVPAVRWCVPKAAASRCMFTYAPFSQSAEFSHPISLSAYSICFAAQTE